MKKLLLSIIALSLILYGTINAQQMRKSAIMQQTQFEITGTFSPTKIETFGYNTSKFDDEKSSIVENDSVPISSTTFDYDGNIVTGTTNVWMNSEWQISIRTKSYLNGNDVDSTITFQYDTINGTWEKASKWVQEFVDNIHTRDMIYISDSLTGNWIAMMKTDYTYNGNLLSEETMSMYIPDAEQWLTMSKDKYYYVDGRLDKVEFLMPVYGTSDFQVNSRTNYFYKEDGTLDYEIDYSVNMFTQQ